MKKYCTVRSKSDRRKKYRMVVLGPRRAMHVGDPCQGWIFSGTPRHCRHTREALRRVGA